MKNDRGKGIFTSNIQAPLSKRRQASSAAIEEEDVQHLEAVAAAAASNQVNSSKIDVMHLLNPYSV